MRDGTGAVPYGLGRARIICRGRPLCLPSAPPSANAPFSFLGVQAASLHEGFLYVFSHSLTNFTVPSVILDPPFCHSRHFYAGMTEGGSGYGTNPIGPKGMLAMGQKIYTLAITQMLVKGRSAHCE